MNLNCYNTDCSWRSNETSNPAHCDCIACQHRTVQDFTVIATDRTEPLDVAPIRHAHWFGVGSLSCRCSGCGCKNDRETAYCPNCGAKMQPVGNSDMLNTPQTHTDAIENARARLNKEEPNMYTKKFSSILDVISHEIKDETVARWVSRYAMESEENTREVAEGLGYINDD